MRELGEEFICIPPFLKIKVSTVVYCLYHNFFPAFSGEDDHRNVGVHRPYRFQKSDPIHFRHIIIHDKTVIGEELPAFYGLDRIVGDINLKRVNNHQIFADCLEHGGFIIDE